MQNERTIAIEARPYFGMGIVSGAVCSVRNEADRRARPDQTLPKFAGPINRAWANLAGFFGILGHRQCRSVRFMYMFALLLCLAATGRAEIQPLDFTLNATPAASVNLAGRWRIARDPDNIGKAAGWFRQGPIEGAVSADVPNPLELTFPGYDGVVWYWRSFDGSELAKFDDVRIHFQGADYYAEAWLNDEYLGGNESALLPFAFDARKALRPGSNQLVVRVVDASYAKEVDGFRLGDVAGGRQHDNPMEEGFRHENYGGLLLPVTAQAFARPWIGDGFIRPDIKGSKIDIDLRIVGAGGMAEWKVVIRPVYPKPGPAVVARTVWVSPNAEGLATISVHIPNVHLWRVWNSFLYEIALTPPKGTPWRERFGMREVSILNGRIAINGKPILRRSYLYNQIWPVTLGVPYGDLARRDIELTRQTNANMLRCFSKTPVPATVDAADEVGILLQTETLASWYLLRGEKQYERLKNLTERTTLLYRNHPSIFWWNILNENEATEDPKREYPSDSMLLGPYVLRSVLPSIHALDPTRPAIANDPIWKGVPGVWEPGQSAPTLPLIGDHYYLFTGLETHEDYWLKSRGRAWGDKPNPNAPYLGITEWGHNSSPEWDRLLASYKANGVREDAEDFVVYRKMLEMNRRWYEQSGISKQGFPTFESVLAANREEVAHRYRENFALIWGNVHSVGHGLTSLEDSSYELSGVVDNWRNPKPVVFDAITELNRPLQINLWLRPSSVYVNDPITFDATLVNEGQALNPGSYPLSVRLLDGNNHAAFVEKYRQEIAGDLIEFLRIESIPLNVHPGRYKLELELGSGREKLAASLPVQVSERKPRPLHVTSTVWVWEKGDVLANWLRERGVSSRPGDVDRIRSGDIILISGIELSKDTMMQIQAAVQNGACAVMLAPDIVLGGRKEDPQTKELYHSSWLQRVSGSWKPELRTISWWGRPGAWGYSRTALALKHPFLSGLPQAVPLEAQPVYQRIAPKFTWLLSGQPDGIVLDRAIVESALHVDLPYTTDLASIPFGKGSLILNTLRIVENLGADPAADRILENILTNLTGGPSHAAPE